jgi:tRNA pseudouridine-54 N-methylase
LGFSPAIRSRWLQLGAQSVSVGPMQLFSEDVIAIVSNELDRGLDHSGVTP